MKEKLTRKSSAELTRRQIDWAEFDALSDEQIAAAVRKDPDAAPIVGQSWFKSARPALTARVLDVGDRISVESKPTRPRGAATSSEPELVGAFGEKAVEAELLRRGWRTANFNSSIKNAANYDLVAWKSKRTVQLRVKTCGPGWNAFQFSMKPGQELPTAEVGDTDYTILVRMGAVREDDLFYVVPTRTLREQINAWRSEALSQARPQSDRGHWTLRLAERRGGEDRPNYGFERKWKCYLNNWRLLDH